MAGKLDAGWGFPGAAKKAHWFDEGETRSLCGKWMFTGPRAPGSGKPSPDDCAPCARKLADRGALGA